MLGKKAVEKSHLRVLVAYYFKAGHAKQIAQDIVRQIDADLEEINDQKIMNWTLRLYFRRQECND